MLRVLDATVLLLSSQVKFQLQFQLQTPDVFRYNTMHNRLPNTIDNPILLIN